MSLTEVSGASTPESSPEPAAAPATRAPRRPAPLAALLLRLHFYAGVLVAPFLVVAALTGLAYTVTPQLDQILYGDQLTVATAGDQPKPLAEQVTAARAAHPDGTLTAVAPGTGEQTTAVVFSLPELGDRQHTVYVDPYTGEVRGQLTTWFGSTPATTWLDDLHRNLHLGDLGRHYSEIAASWLWVLALGGVILWWRRRRTGRGQVKHLLVPDLSAGKGVRRTRGWHATTGLWLVVGLLILSATGLTWSRFAGANFAAGLDALDARRPAVSTSLTDAPSAGGGEHQHGGAPTAASADPATFDRVLAAARQAGLSGPVEVVPGEPDHAWTVTQTDNTWPVRRDQVAVDPETGTVTARNDFADWPALAKLSALGVQAHMGLLFGTVNQILLAALAVGLLCVIVWGYRMWWQRRPTRGDRRAPVGAPPARGALRGLPWWALLVGVPVVAAIGWALPWFGVTLLGFLVVDVVLGVLARRRDNRLRDHDRLRDDAPASTGR
ncbi:PepSY-associated TM helix domain-containing protein [Micromonospora endophytica]|uniref:Peptidase n=1 Tax=Micromonospora endophytica TaxID=515350 RepID=A0A2W2DDH9_9ACTN|nr:PepSY-associated TM helix domain-containing protein [Micromonospora endophytica]PZF98899.1 peptidase [Micromonospora endophytica]RIW44364.1 PepSY domain-containing protein [Micromonospora endophytica]BCJ62438.1 membrane protein [Micromonospora endophytica]